MRYFAGIDGGATKTQCLIGDEEGNILASGFAGPANYQVVGKEGAQGSLEAAFHQALSEAELVPDQIAHVLLGLAGADLEQDFKVLNQVCQGIFGTVPFTVVNDCWIGLKAGNPDNWGVVTVGGTGANAAGRTQDGKEVILRGMSYEMGNWGGGMDLLRDALHWAFRSEEETAEKTLLAEEIPKLLGKKTMAEIVDTVRSQQVDQEIIFAIPIIVFKLASEGDVVCQEILISMGRTLGEMAGGIIHRLGIKDPEVPVTLVGSMFKGTNPLLIDEYTTTVHRTAPRAKIRVADAEPAYGAYLMAREKCLA
ncbi:glucosamine kinase GspK [Peptococcaceae bacterium CEB3]|nr:glucosamine kinase GspK [Peptococcaceae bacterium CEB3]